HKGDIRQAHSCRVTAAQLVEQAGDNCPSHLRMCVDGDLGRSCIAANDWARGESYTRNALRLAEELGEEQLRLIYQVNLGWVLTETGRVGEAKKLAEEVLREAERSQDNYVLALQHLNLANILLHDEHRLNE